MRQRYVSVLVFMIAINAVCAGADVQRSTDALLRWPTAAEQDTKRIVVRPWEVERTFEYGKIYTEFHFGTVQKGSGVLVSVGAIKQESQYRGYGLGLDYTEYSVTSPHGMIAPHFIYRGYLTNKKHGLYVTGRAGYGLSVSDRSGGEFTGSGGLFSEAAVGYRVGLLKPMLMISVGMRVQKGRFDFVSPSFAVLEDIWFKRLSISLGIKF